MRNVVWVEKQTELEQKFVCPKCHGLVTDSRCFNCLEEFDWEELHLMILPEDDKEKK